ncbi:hypothetical protein RFI_10011 [Reticulomyxa filosa]|uniref:Uncharacterized protein n=1 Tax=Reticulomyxa filosa TaxID=46433 RepID=X6NM80_RETFI|nr:hypothetical protein RFI_10011 [Reticulomyxa filosa]|eukprot:ETO27121.1 hypothetical protein RFI_10011 [Reticulomyxa filosa]
MSHSTPITANTNNAQTTNVKPKIEKLSIGSLASTKTFLEKIKNQNEKLQEQIKKDGIEKISIEHEPDISNANKDYISLNLFFPEDVDEETWAKQIKQNTDNLLGINSK